MYRLEGILPICAGCRKIRDDNTQWQPIEKYIQERAAVDFKHGLCEECVERLYPELITKVKDIAD